MLSQKCSAYYGGDEMLYRRQRATRPAQTGRRPAAVLRGIGLIAVLAASACGGGAGSTNTTTGASGATGPECVKDEQGDRCLPLSPESRRVDRATPTFSSPTAITNPLFPARNDQMIQLGTVDGIPFRAEVTLLPGEKTIRWNGQQVATVISQYVGYLDGRIHEVAIDWYAQADDGAVWYFGEDVFNYEDGAIADTEGTWIAGRDGPPGIIMPANPKPGDVYRPENAPGVVFEEVTVTSTGQTATGPRGPVDGVLEVRELHMDGKFEDKSFAPRYGELSTGSGTDVEAVAVAVPTDALPGPPPEPLVMLTSGAGALFEAAGEGDWAGAATATAALRTAWDTYRISDVPAALDRQMSGALATLDATAARDPEETRVAALDVWRTSLDLRLRYQPATEIDHARLDLWAGQLRLDVEAGEKSDVLGDVATLETVWDRVRHTAAPADAARVDAQLAGLRAAADEGNLAAVEAAVPALRSSMAARPAA